MNSLNVSSLKKVSLDFNRQNINFNIDKNVEKKYLLYTVDNKLFIISNQIESNKDIRLMII